MDRQHKMTLEEAHDMKRLLSDRPSDGLSVFEHELLTLSQDIISQAKADSLQENLNKKDIKELTELYSFLQNIDVESHKEVEEAQKVLKEFGYYEDEIDSFYGKNTKAARQQMTTDILQHPDFVSNFIIEGAKDLFDKVWGE